MAGAGKHENEMENVELRVKRETLDCAGQKLDSAEIRAVFHEVKPTTKTDDEKTNVIGKRINSAMLMVRKLLQDDGTATVEIDHTQRASTFHRDIPAPAPKATAKAKAKTNEKSRVVRVEIYRKIYHNAYNQWRKQLKESEKTPTEVQWRFMGAVHYRCETEAIEEHRGKVHKKTTDPSKLFHGQAGNGAEPARLFVHGLPG